MEGLEIIRRLAEGNFGAVFLARRVETGAHFQESLQSLDTQALPRIFANGLSMFLRAGEIRSLVTYIHGVCTLRVTGKRANFCGIRCWGGVTQTPVVNKERVESSVRGSSKTNIPKLSRSRFQSLHCKPGKFLTMQAKVPSRLVEHSAKGTRHCH